LEHVGIDAIWNIVERYRSTMVANGEFEKIRSAQATAWLWHEAAEILLSLLRNDTKLRDRMTALEAAVANGETSPGIAAQELVQQFLNGKKGQT
jgi:LAO/AO transport system kinase